MIGKRLSIAGPIYFQEGSKGVIAQHHTFDTRLTRFILHLLFLKAPEGRKVYRKPESHTPSSPRGAKGARIITLIGYETFIIAGAPLFRWTSGPTKRGKDCGFCPFCHQKVCRSLLHPFDGASSQCRRGFAYNSELYSFPHSLDKNKVIIK